MPGKYDRVVRRSRKKWTARPPITDDQVVRGQELVDDGCSLREAARTLGVGVGSLTRKGVGPGWTTEQAREWRQIRREAA